jgi:hypothetical protein
MFAERECVCSLAPAKPFVSRETLLWQGDKSMAVNTDEIWADRTANATDGALLPTANKDFRNNIYQEPQLISHIIEVWRDDGLPPMFHYSILKPMLMGGGGGGRLWRTVVGRFFCRVSKRRWPSHFLLSRLALFSTAPGLRQQLADLSHVYG